MKITHEFLRLYIIPLVLIAGIILTTTLTVFFTATIVSSDGTIVSSSWPKDFTQDFADYLIQTNDSIAVAEEGQELLTKHGLWLQVLDPDGNEIVEFDKPSAIPTHYQPKELLDIFREGYETSTVFVSSFHTEELTYTYLIGFPLSLSKVISYVDDSRYQTGKYLIIAAILLTLLLLILLTVFYYIKMQKADKQRTQDEYAKKEWLTNITHDLKTPLVPIRGYAELLSEMSEEQLHRYGEIILKNVLYAEQLVDDLKITYQLQSNTLPLNAVNGNLVRLIKEIIIDLMNTPEYEDRNLSFSCDRDEVLYRFDERLLKRALLNILVNSLKHNTSETSVFVSIQSGSPITITIRDDGCGMSPVELAGLFTRYYRGTNMETKAEGSGLGMAIAKQIIEAHHGTIQAASTQHHGTTITIQLSI